MPNIILLNTRPLAQQRETHDAFVANGFSVIDFPCIEITPVANSKDVIVKLNDIQAQDIIIFTSPSSVSCTYTVHPDWFVPPGAMVITVGSKTAECLRKYSTAKVETPKQQNSQGVIDILSGLTNCAKVQLITAANGRQQIQDFCSNKQTRLVQINVYQRTIPNKGNARYTSTIKQIEQAQELYILATSTSILENLKQLVTTSLWQKLQNDFLLCASARIEIYAKQMAFKNTINLKTANPYKISEYLQAVLKK